MVESINGYTRVVSTRNSHLDTNNIAFLMNYYNLSSESSSYCCENECIYNCGNYNIPLNWIVTSKNINYSSVVNNLGQQNIYDSYYNGNNKYQTQNLYIGTSYEEFISYISYDYFYICKNTVGAHVVGTGNIYPYLIDYIYLIDLFNMGYDVATGYDLMAMMHKCINYINYEKSDCESLIIETEDGHIKIDDITFLT